jgi:hypothetical protein
MKAALTNFFLKLMKVLPNEVILGTHDRSQVVSIKSILELIPGDLNEIIFGLRTQASRFLLLGAHAIASSMKSYRSS